MHSGYQHRFNASARVDSNESQRQYRFSSGDPAETVRRIVEAYPGSSPGLRGLNGLSPKNHGSHYPQ